MSAAHQPSSNDRPPPIGERKYLFDKESAQPVVIQSASKASEAHYLKDPIQPGQLVPPKVVSVKKQAKIAAGPKTKPGQLRFKKVLVSGHTILPRVEFSRDVLPVGRADEPVTQDFFQKVFEPATRDDF